MNKELPNKFTFTCDEEKYSAELIHGEYWVTWDNMGSIRPLYYPIESVQRNVSRSDWILVPDTSTYNGVDDKGNPLNFVPDMFELFQIVQIRNGMYYLVARDGLSDKNAFICKDNTWLPLNVTYIHDNSDFDVVKVFEPNSVYNTLIFDHIQGKLIWQANSQETEQQKEIRELEESINRDAARLGDLKSKLNGQ